MRDDTALVQGFNKQEPIPGYFTKELLGVGGCGEVWKTHAPGGLLKAIKFVYADPNSKRASREIRSLNRIKEVRHPFLLSIERIEVIDGNVIIVTELADESLKQHYQTCRANGLPGLAREALLAFLRDAADALDYIYENYSLQHLDIKPENLLLVGNRAKVSDFGLIKNLYDRSASLIEGLTPIYAPPELFEGKPNRHSDQYSLAIVYQEMLTGELPFDGTTAARLAAQHLHMAPELSALPTADQPVIARALSKNPDQRFASCRSLVDALIESSGGKLGTKSDPAIRRGNHHSARPETLSKTESLGERPFGNAPVQVASCAKSEHAAHMPSIDLNDGTVTQFGPVLFVGIGGMATRVVRRLRRRLHDQLGTMNEIPAVDLLLLDTDVKSLNKATEGESGTALNVSEILAMPLRRTEDYRSAAGGILNSISRRWLYNLPLSLQTEGFRPLGRLAMVDHSKRLRERLRQALVKVTSDENLAKTAQHTGLDFSSRQPRVFIVASTSGGTGGGMLLDMAYAVRSILAELDLADGNVHGILLHATPRGASERDKAIANSYATLSELWHYSRPGQCFPGDRACGLPPFHGNNRTFSSCYYVPLGDDLTEAQLDVATDPVAEYLYCSAVTPAARFFEKCRHVEHAGSEAELTEPTLRTFGLCQLDGSNSDIPTIVAELLCRDLVSNWRSGMATPVERTGPRLSETLALIAAHGETKQSRFGEIDQQAVAKSIELELDLERMKEVAREILDQEVSSSIESYFARLIREAFETHAADVDREAVTRVFAIIDAVFGVGGAENSNEATFDSLSAVLNTRVEGRAGKLATAVCDWIHDLADAPDGVEGAKHAAEWFQSHLRTLQGTTVNTVNHLREEIEAFQDAVLKPLDDNRGATVGKRPDVKSLREAHIRMVEYARLRVEQIVLCSVTRWLRLVEARVIATLDRLQDFWKDLNHLVGAFQVAPSLDKAFDGCGVPEIISSQWRSLLSDLLGHRQQLVATLDRDIEKTLSVGSGKLRWFLAQTTSIQNQLIAPLRAAARQLVLSEMQNLNITRLADHAQGSDSDNSCELGRCVEAAWPRLLDKSAATRLLLIVPQDTDEATLLKSLDAENGPPVTIIRSPGGSFIACQEAELLQVRRVAARLVDDRPDYVEIASRLHARVDVNWDDMSAGSPLGN